MVLEGWPTRDVSRQERVHKMSGYSCFDIIGPIMVGPSSSHTAGAVRLGRLARTIADGLPKSVEIILHGSFAQTYKGHGTDLALLGGLLGMETDDVRIKESYALAEEAGLNFTIKTACLGDKYHVNTVKFVIVNQDGYEITVLGSSLGGGKVMINELNDFPVEIEGRLPTVIATHMDQPGVISTITGILGKYGVNIAAMKVFRKEKRTVAYMIMETDEYVPQEAMEELMALKVIVDVKFVAPV